MYPCSRLRRIRCLVVRFGAEFSMILNGLLSARLRNEIILSYYGRSIYLNCRTILVANMIIYRYSPKYLGCARAITYLPFG